MADRVLVNTVYRLIEDYFWGWQYENWEQVRSTLATDVRFEDPKLGCFDGIDSHLALYANSQRFPNLKGVASRRVANNQDVGFLSYDVYLAHDRVATVIDQLTVREGKIVYVLSVMSEWPEGYPDLSNIST